MRAVFTYLGQVLLCSKLGACLPPHLVQDAWRGRQSAATTLAHMDNFFKTVLTSSMGNDLQVGAGGVQQCRAGGQLVMQA